MQRRRYKQRRIRPSHNPVSGVSDPACDSVPAGRVRRHRPPGYASSSKHGPVRFVIALRGNNGAMRFELLKAIESEL
jgi:hypothetical protein